MKKIQIYVLVERVRIQLEVLFVNVQRAIKQILVIIAVKILTNAEKLEIYVKMENAKILQEASSVFVLVE